MLKKIILVNSLLLLVALCLYAQPGDPNGGQNPDTPITGIEYLIGLGGLLGLKKILQAKKNKER